MKLARPTIFSPLFSPPFHVNNHFSRTNQRVLLLCSTQVATCVGKGLRKSLSSSLSCVNHWHTAAACATAKHVVSLRFGTRVAAMHSSLRLRTDDPRAMPTADRSVITIERRCARHARTHVLQKLLLLVGDKVNGLSIDTCPQF